METFEMRVDDRRHRERAPELPSARPLHESVPFRVTDQIETVRKESARRQKTTETNRNQPWSGSPGHSRFPDHPRRSEVWAERNS